MLKADAIAHFGSQAKIARALNITEAAVSLWGDVVPEGSAYKLESVTRRVLRVNPALYAKSHVHPKGAGQALSR